MRAFTTLQTFEDGDIEYKFLGPHQDQRKTKELQDQGKKINLSLSEARIAYFAWKTR